jgi:tRNA-dihydrouridine synthase B
MKIGNLKIKNNIFLAPMAGVTDISFRILCKNMGCGLTFTEMVRAKGLLYDNQKTKKILEIDKEEGTVGVQIYGNEPEIMSEVVKMFNKDYNVCLIDINMGCPVRKVVKTGCGAALMKTPKLAFEIVREIKKVSTKPVTVKFRKGWDENNINAIEFAQLLEEAGADAITVHGRTREQMYKGKSDWGIIKQIKQKVKIPVIGNGDLFTAEDVKKMFEETGCDGVMIARGALGNPWIFKQVLQLLSKEKVFYPTEIEKIEMYKAHLLRAVKFFGENRAVKEMRKHLGWYLKGLKNCSKIKQLVQTEKSLQKVLEIVDDYKRQFIKLKLDN